MRNNFAGPFDSQMPVGRQALREYWPIRVAPDDPQRLYRTVRAGADLELFILDTRQYRSPNADQDGPAKTMLGEQQLQWLLSGLTESTATWKVIVTTVPLSISKGGGAGVPGNDGWAGGADGTGFERERQVIVDSILGRRVKNVVFLAGDVHYVQANAYDPNGDGTSDFHEFMVGPLSAAPGPQTPARGGLRPTTLINEGGYMNFGLVRVTKSSFDVTVIDEAGATRFFHHLSPSNWHRHCEDPLEFWTGWPVTVHVRCARDCGSDEVRDVTAADVRAGRSDGAVGLWPDSGWGLA